MSLNLLTFLFFYFFIINSVIGYGYFVAKINKIEIKFFDHGYLGLLGIFFLLIISFVSHYFIAHNYTHNSIILIFGFLFFVYFFLKEKKKNEIINLNLFFLLIFISFIIFKSHDDFSYYHFQYIYYLTQSDILIGIGNFNHGFRTVSSIFYLNSLFYLPIIKYYFFQMGAILIMGFACYHFIVSIKECLKKKIYDKFFFLSLFFFMFIMIFFYRIAEHGTDRSAQILIFLLVFDIIKTINFNQGIKENISKIIIILGLIISLKAFYLLYIIFILPIFYYFFKDNKLSYIFLIFKNKLFYFFLIIFINIFLINFANSGCLIYPVSFTCVEKFSWAIPLSEVSLMNDWYEQWSKAGANPNFRVDDPEKYIQHFNWVPNWINEYFFTKVSDFLLGVIFLILIILIVFKSKKKIPYYIYSGEKIIYFIIFLLFFEWFYNHPSLRYGGYPLICLMLFLPISTFLSSRIHKGNIVLKTNILVLIALTIFVGRNMNRLKIENEKYQFNPLESPVYRINENYFLIQKKLNCDPNLDLCSFENSITAKNKNGFKIFYRKLR